MTLNYSNKNMTTIKNFDNLVGKTYAFQCARYIYHGKVELVNETYIELTKAGIVYETGELKASKAEDRKELPSNVFVMKNAIESFYSPKW